MVEPLLGLLVLPAFFFIAISLIIAVPLFLAGLPLFVYRLIRNKKRQSPWQVAKETYL